MNPEESLSHAHPPAPPPPASLQFPRQNPAACTLKSSPIHVAKLLSAGLGTSGQHRRVNQLLKDEILEKEVSSSPCVVCG